MNLEDRTILTDAQWAKIEDLLPGRVGWAGRNAKDNRLFVEGILWILRTGAPWRDFPKTYGNWNSAFKRFRVWIKKGIWTRIFEYLRDEPDMEWIAIDASVIRAHQHSAGALKKGETPEQSRENQALGRSRGGLSTKIHVIVDALGYPIDFVLTPGQVSDITQAERLINDKEFHCLLGDKGYDADSLLTLIKAKGAESVIPPKSNRKDQREYDKHLYKERNIVERFFNRIKQFRRIATRFDKIATSFLAMLTIASCIVWLR